LALCGVIDGTSDASVPKDPVRPPRQNKQTNLEDGGNVKMVATEIGQMHSGHKAITNITQHAAAIHDPHNRLAALAYILNSTGTSPLLLYNNAFYRCTPLLLFKNIFYEKQQAEDDWNE